MCVGGEFLQSQSHIIQHACSADILFSYINTGGNNFSSVDILTILHRICIVNILKNPQAHSQYKNLPGLLHTNRIVLPYMGLLVAKLIYHSLSLTACMPVPEPPLIITEPGLAWSGLHGLRYTTL